MSTVPETILARHAGLRAGLRSSPKMGCGLQAEALSHAFIAGRGRRQRAARWPCRSGDAALPEQTPICQQTARLALARPRPDQPERPGTARPTLRPVAPPQRRPAAWRRCASIIRSCRWRGAMRRPAWRWRGGRELSEGNDDIERAVRPQQIVAAGAGKIDLVLPWRALMASDTAGPAALLRAVRRECEGRVLKVILEKRRAEDAGADRRRLAHRLAEGADFKTSTGKTPTGATPKRRA